MVEGWGLSQHNCCVITWQDYSLNLALRVEYWLSVGWDKQIINGTAKDFNKVGEALEVPRLLPSLLSPTPHHLSTGLSTGRLWLWKSRPGVVENRWYVVYVPLLNISPNLCGLVLYVRFDIVILVNYITNKRFFVSEREMTFFSRLIYSRDGKPAGMSLPALRLR